MGSISSRHREARADVVAERDGAQEPRAIDTATLTEGKRGGHDRGTRMRLRRPVRVVGLVGVRERAVDERGGAGVESKVGTDHGRRTAVRLRGREA